MPGIAETGSPLSPHYNPFRSSSEQPRRFPRQSNRFLASFANIISNGNSLSFVGRQTKACSIILHAHSRQATLPTATLAAQAAAAPRSRFNPKSYSIPLPEGKQIRSTSIGLHGKGVTSACHCGPPLNLNPQHKPPTGRRKPAQGTSSMCPLTDF